MAFDFNKSFEVRSDGLVIDGAGGLFSGSGSPSGNQAPEGSYYLRTDNYSLWKKVGPNATDWRQISAADITFDPSLVDLTTNNVQLAISELAIRNNGKDFNSVSKTADETTTGASYATYSSLDLVATGSAVATPNRYRINADFIWGHNSASNDILVRISYLGTTLKEVRIEPKDAGADQRFQNNLLTYVDNVPVGTYSIDLQYRPAVSSRTSRMYSSVIECWRVI